MLIEETVTYLEMTSLDRLVPGRQPPAPVEMRKLDRTSEPLFRSTYERVGAPHGWIGRAVWSEQQWEEFLSHPGVLAWIARVGGEVVGLVELETRPDGDVEIVSFGLVPEFVGKGFGGHLLTVATRLAWEATAVDGSATTRVWLHTSSRDHPNARPNYEGRGFRPYRTEHRQRVLPEPS
jgi:GNAT superfamily N-acetyltransferase